MRGKRVKELRRQFPLVIGHNPKKGWTEDRGRQVIQHKDEFKLFKKLWKAGQIETEV